MTYRENTGMHGHAPASDIDLKEAELLADQVLAVCGPEKTLILDDGNGLLLRCLLTRGVDSRVVSPSPEDAALCRVQFPGRCHVRIQGGIPFSDAGFVTVIAFLDSLGMDERTACEALREMRRVCSRYLFLRIRLAFSGDAAKDRTWWEELCLTVGFRFHAREMSCVPYASRNYGDNPCTIVLEKLSDSQACFAMADGDCLRTANRWAEASRAAYHEAARLVRRGDTVLELGCGCGHGSHILYGNSLGARVTGLDADPAAIAYANGQYARGDAVTFTEGGWAALDSLAEDSVDFLVCFGGLQHVDDPVRRLNMMRRVLRPAGRIFLGVPLGSYTWRRVREEVGTVFVPEKKFALTTGDTRARMWREIGLDAEDECEWAFMVGVKDPLVGRRETFFRLSEAHTRGVGASLHNPWLFDGLLNIEFRNSDRKALSELAERARSSSQPGSTDKALSLCVLAYRHLEACAQGDESDFPEKLLREIEEWLSCEHCDPPGLRWTASLWFILGRIYQRKGLYEAADDAFEKCAAIDPVPIAPTLGEKTGLALYNQALMAMGRGDREGAASLLRRAYTTLGECLKHIFIPAADSLNYSCWWHFSDMRRVLNVAEKCYGLITNLQSYEARPGTAFSSFPGARPEPPLLLSSPAVNLRKWAETFACREVYFWGCGEFYTRYKHLFYSSSPRCILLDYNPERITERDGLPVLDPRDVFPVEPNLPIIVFAWDTARILLTISRAFPEYIVADANICIPKSWGPGGAGMPVRGGGQDVGEP